MLAVTTAQLYSHAFAMPMDMNSTLSPQINSLHIMNFSEDVNAAEEDCCEKPTIVVMDEHCSTMEEPSTHNCADMNDCAQSQCVSPVGCGVSNYIFHLDTSITTQTYNNHILIDPNSGSLYRPPIFR
ncbi:hypothetical protein [Neptunomonas sp.]|uniref:hypothetical protein n=1 Tax=Neptunomonas sp. TaxID=1971898 RepID=UPI0025DD3050|nr:hypothetical protein [Neptunomonas sp.]